MAANKKPKKKYRPKYMKGGNLPPNVEVAVDWKLRAWNALEALKEGRYDHKIGLDLIMFLTVCRSVIPNDCTEVLLYLQKVFQALNSIKDRHTRTGKWGWSGQERSDLLEYVPMFIDLYGQMNREEVRDGLRMVQERLALSAMRIQVKEQVRRERESQSEGTGSSGMAQIEAGGTGNGSGEQRG